jgi:hypothetical protein
MVNFSFLNLFLDTWIWDPDPDAEYGSGSQIQAQIECGSNRIRIRNTVYSYSIRQQNYITQKKCSILRRFLALICGTCNKKKD